MTTCPLCLRDETELVETLDGTALNEQWEYTLGLSDPLRAESLDYIACSACGLRFFYPPESGGPELYEDLQRFEWYYMTEKPEFGIALPHLEEAASILEVGAGEGSFARHLGERRYVGLDFNQRGVQAARTAGIDLRNEDVATHAERGNRYDAVVTFQVLEHIPDPRTFLLSCLRCLNPSGRLIVAVPAFEGFVGSGVNVVLNMPPHHVTHWSDRTFEFVAEAFGLRLLSLEHEPVADFHSVWARAVLMERRIRRLLLLQPKLLDSRPRARFATHAARYLSKLDRSPVASIAGHSVVAVFQAPYSGPAT